MYYIRYYDTYILRICLCSKYNALNSRYNVAVNLFVIAYYILYVMDDSSEMAAAARQHVATKHSRDYDLGCGLHLTILYLLLNRPTPHSTTTTRPQTTHNTQAKHTDNSTGRRYMMQEHDTRLVFIYYTPELERNEWPRNGGFE